MLPLKHKSKANSGFSLIELAIVLVIVATLSVGTLSALRLHTERANLLEARSMLAEAREALLNHAAVSGNLPCPDTNDDGDPDACPANGALVGRVPWRLLALPERDPWGQTLNYSVHSSFASGRTIALTSLGGIDIRSASSNGSSESLANPESVAMALWSSGANGSQEAGREAPFQLFAEAPESDDLVVWLSRFVLIGRMLEAGRSL